MTSLIYLVCYLSAALLAAAVIFTANNLNRHSCACLKSCLFLIMLGMLGLTLAVFYEWSRMDSLLCMLPLAWGVAGWLIFSGCQSHQWMSKARAILQRLSLRRFLKTR